jgi:1,2-dihydroxy-3-keto-5-methylthiopentene dioxygenase
MSRLRIFNAEQPQTSPSVHEDHAAITRELAKVGVRFEQWEASQPVEPGASQDEVIAAYHSDIDRLMREEGYQSVDVISLKPDHPDRAALRQKFLSEHTHSEDEVRFFVAGAGQFTLHIEGKIYDVLCEQGDLIGVPDGTRHWFDMDGWVANFTGSDIAQHFPRMQPLVTASA